ncbi:MAG: methyl-accepting chemotaxis protein [Stigonema ocellatum SAG 48.90 = DSM 106950]|nr:methyl-accepting chemotaxis protein [Stigonema ocellatum SAG 48.90 = DSM 106950]
MSIFSSRPFQLQEDTKKIEHSIRNADEMADGISRMIASIRGYLIFPGDQYYVGTYKAGKDTFREKYKALQTITDPKTRELVNQLNQLGENYDEISQNFFRLVDAKNLDAAKTEVSKPRVAKLTEMKNQLVQELENQLNKNSEEITKSQNFIAGMYILGNGLVLLATLMVGLWISLPLKQQLPKVVHAAEGIADGDLTQTIEVIQDQSEVGQLLAAFQRMTKSLNSLISQTQKSGIQMTTSTTQIAATGRQLQATVTAQAASTNEVSATSMQIAATSGQLVKTMDQITEKAQVTALAASNSQANLMQMALAMRSLAVATTSISSTLGMMNEKANNINSVVTTITKVADQTNLLSLNAAIEAEKAGEYGAGFAVVAREIRRLADQTAVATLEIEQMVKEMQSSVSTGVMEMDKFNQDVSNSVEQVGKISGEIALVIEQVQSLTPRFEEVSHSMEQQFQGAQQISSTIAHLSETSQQTVQALHETNKALEQLDDAAQGLQGVVSQFKVQR